MKCELVKENIILASYGELPDEFAGALEQHLDGCEDCLREWDAMRILEEKLALASGGGALAQSSGAVANAAR